MNDNHGLSEALKSGYPVLPLFIFDAEILDKLNDDDRRVPFIHRQILQLNEELNASGNRLLVFYDKPFEVFRKLIDLVDIAGVYTNRDYEPYAVERDRIIEELLSGSGIPLLKYKDQVIWDPGEVVKPDGLPYEVFTPFSKKWLSLYNQAPEKLTGQFLIDKSGLALPDSLKYWQTIPGLSLPIPSLSDLGFRESDIEYPAKNLNSNKLKDYGKLRDIPSEKGTSRIGLHLRFGTVSIRECVKIASENSEVWLNELIWREFFMHILAFYPRVVDEAFKKQYDSIKWINDEELFKRWCEGKTGYPLVDAGMRELKATGFMHNRVRMVTASFLVKHLLTDWRWGEAWFAQHLLDYELSSNNGNWQWAAGSGCDAAPYFRIFNPLKQQEKFDPQFLYVKKWVPEFGSDQYPQPIVEHEFARERCLAAYKKAVTM